jgi:hypothetical protein
MASDHPPATHEPDRTDRPPPAPPPPPSTDPEPQQPGMPPKPDRNADAETTSSAGPPGDPTEVAPDPRTLEAS